MLSKLHRLPLALQALLPVLLVSAVAAAGLFYSSHVARKADAANTHIIEVDARAATFAASLNLLTLDLGRAVWRAATFGDAAGIETARRDAAQMKLDFETRAANVARAIAGTPLEATLAKIRGDFSHLQGVAERAFELLPRDRDAALAMLQRDFADQIRAARETNRELTAATLANADRRSTEVSAELAGTMLAAQIGIALALLAGMTVAGLGMRQLISRPVSQLEQAMRRIAEGDHATEVPATARGDELGAMARTLQVFGRNLAETEQLRAGQAQARLAAEAERKAAMLRLADDLDAQMGGSVKTIASASTELNAAAGSLAAIAESSASRATEVSETTETATRTVNSVAAATEQLSASVAEIARQVAESARMARAAIERAERSNVTVTSLSEASQKINDVLRLIGDIAGQTNLLALNATIEAARAGEAGKGFAVVASEVKTLASQTARATDGIAQQITAMQEATRAVIGDIAGIGETIAKLGEVTAAIAAAAEEQDAATRDIARSVQDVAGSTQRIASGMSGVRNAAGDTGGAATQVSATSGELAQQAEMLRLKVDQVLATLRAA
jgi:methyl-accepting chemotaxis protein